MKNKAVMKMAKMAGDSRTAMKMKNEAAMKMKKQSAMKMKDPMDMKKDPMKMKKEPMKMKKEPMKMKKGSAMKKKTDNIPSPRVKAPSEAKDRNHPKHKQWVEENLIKYGPGSNKPYNSYEDYLANRDKSPKTMKKGAMKMAKKSPMKKEGKDIPKVDMTSYAKARREKARLKKEREDAKAKATKKIDMTGPARAIREKERLKKEREGRAKRAKS